MFPAMPYKLPGRERSGAIAICHLAQMNKIAAIGTFSLCPAAGRLGEIVWIRHIPATLQPRQFFRALHRHSAQFQVGSGSRPLEAPSFTPLVGSPCTITILLTHIRPLHDVPEGERDTFLRPFQLQLTQGGKPVVLQVVPGSSPREVSFLTPLF